MREDKSFLSNSMKLLPQIPSRFKNIFVVQRPSNLASVKFFKKGRKIWSKKGPFYPKAQCSLDYFYIYLVENKERVISFCKIKINNETAACSEL